MDAIRTALENARAALLAERNEAGHWEGVLSTSALSTATALIALGEVDQVAHDDEIASACQWLIENQNDDGGWGDTVKSFSNISTTLLCWSALSKYGGEKSANAVRNASHWIRDYVGSLEPALIAETVKAQYGRDRTFSVPILMLCAICGTLGKNGWCHVLRLPYELSVFPRSWFAAMRLPVVSYALPALIAIGRATQVQRKKIGFFWNRASKLLVEIQPTSGGFLEAAPLTSFVTMALVAAGEKSHPVAKNGVRFLLETVRPDGSWPIDTNLATWATTLSVKALPEVPRQGSDAILDWLLDQQYTEVHPFTNSPPGGWAWTDLAGGVPDADDTPSALLALAKLQSPGRFEEIRAAAESAIVWLLDLQNRDGGIPTFCRGWGALPFDRSSPDLTAHTLRAWHEWEPEMPEAISSRIGEGKEKAIAYLKTQQRSDGSWVPLWFGNQYRRKDQENPTYGTAMVVRALDDIGLPELADSGVSWLLGNQNADGGWGSGRGTTPSTIEETSLAVSALAFRGEVGDSLNEGAKWLVEATGSGTKFDATPIGFYFARLWYYERTYPMIWAVEALSRVLRARQLDQEI
jgi:squalene-hopene/tetraprenyl-beta-curcumene cyclase